MKRRSVLLLAASLAGSRSFAKEAAYPDRTVRLVVPYPPGGSADLVGRMVAEKMSLSMGQPVIVDNRGGASGAIGSDFVARAPADGYTLLMALSDTHAINPAVMSHLPYDAVRDFARISLLATQPMLLVVGQHMGANTLAEFVAAAKRKPGSVTFASNGKGGLQHLSMELFGRSAGIEMLHVPYKGTAPALTDVMGGQVDSVMISLQGAGGNLGAGGLKAIAAASEKRLAVAPTIPTFAESGYPQIIVWQWYGLMAPRGTPEAVIELVNKHARAAMATQDVASRLRAAGTEPGSSSPEAFRQFQLAELQKWSRVAKSVGVRLD